MKTKTSGVRVQRAALMPDGAVRRSHLVGDPATRPEDIAAILAQAQSAVKQFDDWLRGYGAVAARLDTAVEALDKLLAVATADAVHVDLDAILVDALKQQREKIGRLQAALGTAVTLLVSEVR